MVLSVEAKGEVRVEDAVEVAGVVPVSCAGHAARVTCVISTLLTGGESGLIRCRLEHAAGYFSSSRAARAIELFEFWVKLV